MAIFFIVILSIIIVSTILVLCSSLNIDIKKFEIANKSVIKFELVFSLKLLNKIKWLSLKIDNRKIEKFKENYRLESLNKLIEKKILKKYNNINKVILKDWKKILRILRKFEIEKFNLETKIGTENPAITAYIVATVASILAIILAKKVKHPNYRVEPIYINENYIYLSINCIIAIKLVHIINIIKEFNGKEVYQNYGRTSNRRAYANSNG